MQKDKQLENLVIVGAGPVGMVAALRLKKYFRRVVLLERQSKENFLQKHGFTFPIVFSPASIQILEKVGAWDAIRAERSPFFGVVLHKRILGREITFKSVEEGVHSHWRNHIVACLYERIASTEIEIHFDARLEAIDFENSVCREAQLGELPFDLLLGADGISSQTRGLMAAAHPDFPQSAFGLTLLDHWYAYRLPAKGELRDRYGGGERFLASNVFVDNLPDYPSEKFRVVTTSMVQPAEEISVLVKHSPDLDLERVRELNRVFFGADVESLQELDAAWDQGYAGKFEQVHAPTFTHGNVLLIGDAAHGFESTGDLINLGLASIESFHEIFTRHERLAGALAEYDQTVGEDLRDYARFSLRRSQERIGFEIGAIEVAARLGLTNRHPSLFGIYVDDFEIRKNMKAYRRDLVKSRLLVLGLPAALILLGGWLRSRREIRGKITA